MRRMHLLLVVLSLTSGCQFGQRKPYANDPILRERQVASRPASTMIQMPLEQPFSPNPPRAVATQTAMMTAQAKPTKVQTPELPQVASESHRIPPQELPILEKEPNLDRILGPERPPLPIDNAMLLPGGPAIEEQREPSLPTPTPIAPKVEAKPMPGAPPIQVAGVYDHGPGYIWLQGTLDRHYRGHLNLRYCDSSKDDYWGGKVRLIEDEKLNGLSDGEVVFIEGEMLPPKGESSTEARDGYPSYRIKNLWVVKKP